MSEKITKRILKSPDFDKIVEIIGGSRKAMLFSIFQQKLKEQGLELTYEGENFDSKKDYEDKVIAQEGVIILNDEKIAATKRDQNERKGIDYHHRITNNASIITSSSETDLYDWQEIINKKIDHNNIKAEKGEPDIIAINDTKAGYIFIIKIIRADTDKILGGKGGDEDVKFYNTKQTASVLEQIKPMEYNILQLALQQ